MENTSWDDVTAKGDTERTSVVFLVLVNDGDVGDSLVENSLAIVLLTSWSTE